jgi:hypothetical protein
MNVLSQIVESRIRPDHCGQMVIAMIVFNFMIFRSWRNIGQAIPHADVRLQNVLDGTPTRRFRGTTTKNVI